VRKAFLLWVGCLALILWMAPVTGEAETIYAVTTTNVLLTFDSATPGTIAASVGITGLQAGESILGIDLRPATGQLYALGSTSRLYTINPLTGAATQVGSAGAFTLNGTFFGFDFNPTVDRIRVVSDTDQNLRLNPDTGALAVTDTNLAYAAGDPNFGANPLVTGSAYTNNFSGTATTTLYGIDANLNILVTQNPPNTGTLNTVGALGVIVTSAVGFDISGVTGIAYASLSTGPTINPLYTINLATGAATLIGNITSAVQIIDITVGVQGVPATPTATVTGTPPTATATATATPTSTLTPTATTTAATTLTPTPSPTITTTLSGGGPAAVVPTLSGWAMLTLGLILAAAGLLFIRGGSSPGV
jgi:hypothetical protein